MKTIRVIDFTDLPGPRYIDDDEGETSGEQFRQTHLEKPFEEAVKTRTPLRVDLDGTKHGYPPSFLEESFGGLARIWTDPAASPKLTLTQVADLIVIKSDSAPLYVELVRKMILEADKVRAKRKTKR